ncbi:MAG: PH domain-containing protein [Armatimonadota bacterium]
MSETVLERRISPRAFLGHYLAAAVVGLVLAVVLMLIPGLGMLAPLGLVPIAGVWLYAQLARASHCYRLYEERLEVESGIFSRSIDNLELFRIRDVSMRQTLYGRFAGYGDVIVHSTDASTPQIVIRGIDAPDELYRQLREHVSRSRAQNRTVIVEDGEFAHG